MRKTDQITAAASQKGPRWTGKRRRRSRRSRSQVNISRWQHIAIAIANRYLQEAFRRTEGHSGKDEEEGDKVGVKDQAADLQCRHRTQMAGIVYARLYQKAPSGTAAIQERVSTKRQIGFNKEWEQARQKRFTRLQSANAGRQLQQMSGDLQAAFRSQQEAVIRKSLSFILPAYCAPDGVTIVVTPQADRLATVVFITPESAVTEGFQDFVRRLQGRQQVDRVVLDKCHMVLDRLKGFQPTLYRILYRRAGRPGGTAGGACLWWHTAWRQ
ncbi:hypothetical protein LZ31DRAFT_571661 [Colletotrichum somersetense]|nr:hypothetical protein LZ31DRAFT_571661 [Colletotrichum somersetense]